MVMEVVTLGVGEEIVFGSNVSITVVAVEGEEVHLAVSAPESIPVDCHPAHAPGGESCPTPLPP
jgi:carbon storage regulator CsrA